MGRTSIQIDTPSKRLRLTARRNPYWQGVSGGRGGVSLGYRKSLRGAGTWIGKVVVDGRRIEERIGTADDDGAGPEAMAYRKAVSATLDWSRRRYEAIQAADGKVSTGPTVRSAIAVYVVTRKARSAREGANAEGRLARHVLSDKKFADLPLAKLRAADIESWRGRLPIRTGDETKSDDRLTISPSTANRLLNDLRAALNDTAQRRRRELPAHLPAEIKAGTKATSVATDARKQLLTNQQIKDLVEAASEVDPDGDFGRLVAVAAATGARHSQLRLLRVADVQVDQGRLLMPGAKKGRAARARPPVSVPVSASLIDRLKPVLDRDPDAPLLERWAYKNIGPLKWEKDRRRAWGPAHEISKLWAATTAKAKLPGAIAYALRHSSIVRGLKAGLPVRLVGALHDTSSQMIELHYSAFIVDATEELSRRAALEL